jgi:hypothetical protein
MWAEFSQVHPGLDPESERRNDVRERKLVERQTARHVLLQR